MFKSSKALASGSFASDSLLKFLDSPLLLIQCSVIKFIYIQNS